MTCGSGIRNRSRTCDNPAPAYGGQNCTGNEFNTSACDSNECDGKNYCQSRLTAKL